MEQKKKAGRKKLNPKEKKQMIPIFIRGIDIERLGGFDAIRESIDKYIIIKIFKLNNDDSKQDEVY